MPSTARTYPLSSIATALSRIMKHQNIRLNVEFDSNSIYLTNEKGQIELVPLTEVIEISRDFFGVVNIELKQNL